MVKKHKHRFHFVEKVFEGGGTTFRWMFGHYVPIDSKEPTKAFYKFVCEYCGKIKFLEDTTFTKQNPKGDKQ